MSGYTRSLPSHLRHQSLGGSQQQSPMLLARIADKRAELAHLKELQTLSQGLADQMQVLANKLQTLSDGTQVNAAVLSNWHNVLRAINLASTKLSKAREEEELLKKGSEPSLPQTLVRIPTHSASVPSEPADTGAAAAR